MAIGPSRRRNTAIILPSRVQVDFNDRGLNRMADSFLNVGLVGALHAVAEDARSNHWKDSVSGQKLKHAARSAGESGVQWGTVGALYSGIQYGIEKVRERRNWVNSTIAGASVGALLALRQKRTRSDHDLLSYAITGAAVATAAEFLRQEEAWYMPKPNSAW